MSLLDCLTGLVGLTNIDCPCIEDDRPVDYNVSQSGYYLTDPKYSVPLNAAIFSTSDCYGGSNIWQVLQEALRSGIVQFETDLLAAIYKGNTSRFSTFSGNIGKLEANNLIRGNKTYQGICINPKAIKGGLLSINSISLGLSCSESVTVHISNNKGQVLHSELINTTGGQFETVQLSTPLELPLYSDDCDLKYFVYYESPNNCSALQNKFKCCGRVPKWEKFLNAKGFDSDIVPTSANSNLGYGLSVGASLKCDGMDWICKVTNDGEHATLNVIARSIQLAAIQCLISVVLGSNKINFWTMSNRENLFGKLRKAEKDYNTRVMWLAENLPNDITDCFTCNESKRFAQRRSLF